MGKPILDSFCFENYEGSVNQQDYIFVYYGNLFTPLLLSHYPNDFFQCYLFCNSGDYPSDRCVKGS